MAQQAPPGFFIIDAFEPSGPFGRVRVRDMLDLETLVGGAYDDTTHVESQRQDAGRRTRSIGLGAQDSPTRHHGAFEDLQTRLFGHARSLHWPVFEENGLSPRKKIPADSDGQKLVRPDGLAIRRRRHDNGWSPRELVVAIETASLNSSGLRRSLTPSQLKAIEEQGERISYDQLLLLADGLDCDPVDLIAEGELSSRRARGRMN